MLRFTRTDTPTIMDGLVVRYKVDTHTAQPGEISASRNGVVIGGWWPLLAEGDMAFVMDILRRAWAQHKHLHEHCTLWDRPDGLPEDEVDKLLGAEGHDHVSPKKACFP